MKADMEAALQEMRFCETTQLPKFKKSLNRLLNRRDYDQILTCHSIPSEDLPAFIQQSLNEGNAILIEPEYCGYCVTVWKG